MRIHVLKIWPSFFQEMIDGKKPFEVRKNDRDFRVGDVLKLLAYDPDLGYVDGWVRGNGINVEPAPGSNGRRGVDFAWFDVTYILGPQLSPPGFVVMAVKLRA